MRLLRKSLGRSSHTLRFTSVQGRFLALLEMTMRGRLWVWGSGILVSPPSPWREGSWTFPSFLWKEGKGGGGWLPQWDEGEYTIVRPPVSSSRVQPRDLSCRRENSTYEEVRHSKSYEVRCLPLSHIFCLTSVQGRFLDFARNDDTGKALLSFFACLRRISPLTFIPRAPYPPLWGTFPSRGRLFMTNGEAPLHFSFERASTGNHGLRRPWFPTISSPNMRPLSPLRPCRGRS